MGGSEGKASDDAHDDELVTASPYDRELDVPGINRRADRSRTLAIAAAAIAALAVLGIVFVALPRWMNGNEASEPSRAEHPAEPTAAEANAPAPDSSGRANQVDALRVELLERLRRLDGLGAARWGATEFARVRTKLENADADRQQTPEAARQTFLAAREQLGNLEARAVTVLSSSVIDGERALEQGNRSQAEAKLAIALMIDPANERAKRALTRSKKVDAVFEALAAGRALENLGQPEDWIEARKRYEVANQLDPEIPATRESIARIDAKLEEERFRNAMSKGVGELRKGRLRGAGESFRAALAARPGAAAALEGLAQVSDALQIARIRAAKGDAERAASTESWSDAVAAYEAALQIDSTLAFAREGKERAELRAQLDQRLEGFRQKPERLETAAVRAEAVDLLRAATTLPSPGPRLKGQLEAVAGQIETASSEVSVSFVSDGFTEVSVYRVGAFGRFANKRVDLHPGSYTAVGQRDGFRDVLERFTVEAGQDPAPRVDIRCKERL